VRVLVACEFSGIVRDSFAARGHDCWSCDLLESESPGQHIVGDAMSVAYQSQWDLMIAHPPCTRLTNAGVRWLHTPPKQRTLKEMWAELDADAAFYVALRDAPIEKKAIENPIMHPHAKDRIKPGRRQIVQPWWFGEKAFKATGFELVGLSDLTPTDKLVPPGKGTEEHKQWSQVHRESPGPNRWRNRSRTYKGIAAAMADQWGTNESV